MTKTVKFKSPFFIEGARYGKGLQEVKEQHLDRLPSSAEILDDLTAAAERKAQAEAAKKATEPKSLKEMRSGRANAKPMGKQEPKRRAAPKKEADASAE